MQWYFEKIIGLPLMGKRGKGCLFCSKASLLFRLIVEKFRKKQLCDRKLHYLTIFLIP